MSIQQPSITVSTRDLERLSALLAGAAGQTEAGRALEAELDRAHAVEDDALPEDVVAMHRRVRFSQEDGPCREMTLVYPHEADAEQGRISVLAPVGSALLGLSVGDQIDWPGPAGKPLRVELTEVTPPSAV